LKWVPVQLIEHGDAAEPSVDVASVVDRLAAPNGRAGYAHAQRARCRHTAWPMTDPRWVRHAAGRQVHP
jgi:hypothetical protein